MRQLVRSCFRKGGYVFAADPEETARRFGHSRVARLASNECPFPPPPGVIEAASAELAEAHRYPDPRSSRLVNALRGRYGDRPVVCGVGMDGVIEDLIRTVVEPGERVAISTPTFSFYRLAAIAHGARVVEIPRGPDFSLDPDGFVEEAEDAKIAFICSPNNPTGTTDPVDAIRRILDGFDGLVFLDNAYVEFSGTDYLPLFDASDRLVIGRTFSKVCGLAGLRVGYAFIPAWLGGPLSIARTPFSLNRVSEVAAAAMLRETEHIRRTVEHVRRWRRRFTEECPFPVVPSGANFVLVDVQPLTGDRAAALFAEQGVLVRSCSSFPGLDDHYIRVSVGEDWECEMFLEAAQRI
ncbi:MAG: pyridoxal phosphate-dependent aminotransferase [Methanoculleaceae archaeon]